MVGAIANDIEQFLANLHWTPNLPFRPKEIPFLSLKSGPYPISAPGPAKRSIGLPLRDVQVINIRFQENDVHIPGYVLRPENISPVSALRHMFRKVSSDRACWYSSPIYPYEKAVPADSGWAFRMPTGKNAVKT